MKLLFYLPLTRLFLTVSITSGTLMAAAQSTNIVFPPHRTHVAGNGASPAIFGPFDRKVIQVYAASNFAVRPNKTVLINSISFRYAVPFGDIPYPNGFNGVWPGVSVSLSITPRPHNLFSPVFLQNLGTDLSNVFNGPLLIVATNTRAGPGRIPLPFDVRILFTTPYEYDPSKGNLVLLVETLAGPKDLYLDIYDDFDSGMGMIFTPPANPLVLEYGGHVTQFSIVQENAPPVARAGQNQNLECTGDVTLIQLNGSGSSDPDGDPLTFQWFYGNEVISTSAVTSVTAPQGLHLFTLVVTDTGGLSSTSAVEVAIVDIRAPVISKVSAYPALLWPPNHRMVPVVLTARALDICDSEPRLEIIRVTSSEPSGPQDDWEITGPLTLNLRAERNAKNGGRTYTVAVAATDSSGNRSVRTVHVRVPLNPSLTRIR